MFSIPVRLQGVKGENAGFYTYQIEASVTNQAGETQSSVIHAVSRQPFACFVCRNGRAHL